MDFFTAIFHALAAYELTTIFWGAFFFGESVIMGAAFLAAQGVWSLSNVFWFSLVGTVASDLIWFFFGHRIFAFFGRWQKSKNKYDLMLVKLERRAGKRPFLVLLFIKFFYGTRVLTIMYLSVRKIGFKNFIIFDILGTIIWLVVIIALGWFAGSGVDNIIPIFSKVQYALAFLVLAVIAFKLVTVWMEKRIEKE
ncbi:MAG: VTT domain-containing protein [Parcubacteria group bacterium]|nr:VTT domain-containing protein [Parcubacteria group bacterium]